MKKSVFVFLFVFISAIVLAQAATIWTTDVGGLPKSDFAPLETVYIHGSGFNPSSDVIIGITRPNSFVEIGIVHADSSGSFTYQYNIGDLSVFGVAGTVGTYQVEANDGTNWAWTTFSDAAIWTTNGACGDSGQDANAYVIGEIVYINGEGFSAGTYNWDITGKPGGASCDADIIVASGTKTVGATGAFCFDAYTVQTGDCGEYQVKFSNKGDNYRVDECHAGATETRQCGPTTDAGVCEYGTQTRTCKRGGTWGSYGTCEGAVYPSTEVCDGLDNDCDGQIDEGDVCGVIGECSVGQTLPCSNACFSGFQECLTGSWGPCLTTPPLPTNYGNVCSVGTGECMNEGTIGCDGECSATEGQPGTEICDGLDNDCDGSTDEGGVCEGECTPGAQDSRQCGLTDVGECSYGTQTRYCLQGTWGDWGACTGAVDPVEEVCGDELDNNCDGTIDDGCRKSVPVMGNSMFILLGAATLMLGLYGFKKQGR